MSTPHVGIALPTIEDVEGVETPGVPSVAAAARQVEELGLESVWVADVVVGDGTPSLEATVALATAAAVTDRVQVGFSVLALPTRPVAWIAAQVATLQHLSGHRVVLGVGSGGFPGTPFWDAVGGGEGRGRGQRTDEALKVLPDLIAGKPTRLDGTNGGQVVTLAPPVPVPPILVGGFRDSSVSIRRAATYGDGWFPSLLTPDAVRRGVARLREAAAERGRQINSVTVGIHAIVGEDAAARSASDALIRDIRQAHGIPEEDAAAIPVTGSPQQVAERFAAYAEAGADRLVTAPAGPGLTWMRQSELVADACHTL